MNADDVTRRTWLAADRRVGWVADHRALLQAAVVAAGALVLLSWDPPTARLLLIDAALVAGAQALIAAIAVSARRLPG